MRNCSAEVEQGGRLIELKLAVQFRILHFAFRIKLLTLAECKLGGGAESSGGLPRALARAAPYLTFSTATNPPAPSGIVCTPAGTTHSRPSTRTLKW